MLGFLTHVLLQQQRWEKHLKAADCLQNSTSPAQLMKEHTEAQISGSSFMCKNIFLANSTLPSPSAPQSAEPLLAPEGTQIQSRRRRSLLTDMSPPAALLFQLLFDILG